MSRLIPVLCLIGAIIGAVMSALSLVFIIACRVNPALTGLTVFAVPLLVASTVTAGLTSLLNFMFMKDKLCRIGLLIGVIGIAMVIGGYAGLVI